jgi:hypothetical protein
MAMFVLVVDTSLMNVSISSKRDVGLTTSSNVHLDIWEDSPNQLFPIWRSSFGAFPVLVLTNCRQGTDLSHRGAHEPVALAIRP